MSGFSHAYLLRILPNIRMPLSFNTLSLNESLSFDKQSRCEFSRRCKFKILPKRPLHCHFYKNVVAKPDYEWLELTIRIAKFDLRSLKSSLGKCSSIYPATLSNIKTIAVTVFSFVHSRAILCSPTSVSYTHLDVYKRQG